MHHSGFFGRRGKADAIPANLNQVLSQEQKFMLHRMESCGWRLAFVRRSLFRPPVVVLLNPDRQHYCTLERNGAAVRDPAIPLRRLS